MERTDFQTIACGVPLQLPEFAAQMHEIAELTTVFAAQMHEVAAQMPAFAAQLREVAAQMHEVAEQMPAFAAQLSGLAAEPCELPEESRELPAESRALRDVVNTLSPGEPATVESSFDGSTVHLICGSGGGCGEHPARTATAWPNWEWR